MAVFDTRLTSWNAFHLVLALRPMRPMAVCAAPWLPEGPVSKGSTLHSVHCRHVICKSCRSVLKDLKSKAGQNKQLQHNTPNSADTSLEAAASRKKLGSALSSALLSPSIRPKQASLTQARTTQGPQRHSWLLSIWHSSSTRIIWIISWGRRV